WEGGIRVACAMRWPGRIPAATVLDDPVISLDFLPTFLAVAGANLEPGWKLDGVNLLSRLTGSGKAPLPPRHLFWRGGGSRGPIAVRHGDWKMIHNRQVNAQPELYHLGDDIRETANLAEKHPQRLATLLSQASAWEGELIEPRWGKGSKPIR
ncbi:MAG: sulfatase/phosphatase domain-containing protein, partial [Planctomycetaceae bacterium]